MRLNNVLIYIVDGTPQCFVVIRSCLNEIFKFEIVLLIRDLNYQFFWCYVIKEDIHDIG